MTTPPQESDSVAEMGHSQCRCSGDLDHIVGVLYLDLLRAMSEGEVWNLRSLLHPPLFVPETVQISRLLRMLQQQRLNMAMVVDEHGGVAGLLTIEISLNSSWARSATRESQSRTRRSSSFLMGLW